MYRTYVDVSSFSRLDDERDRRYSTSQVLSFDSSRDRRLNLFHELDLELSEPLTFGRSRFYEPMDVAHNPG